MASMTIKNRCSKCNKSAGTAMCFGCQQGFCTKHFIEHRQELAQRIDELGLERDTLQRILIELNVSSSPTTVINQSEQQSIDRNREATISVLNQLQNSIERTTNELVKSIRTLTNELQTSREFDDYTEFDIKNWTADLKEIRNKLEILARIQIEYSTRFSSNIILSEVNDQEMEQSYFQCSNSSDDKHCVSAESTVQIEERFDEVYGHVSVSENNLAVTKLHDIFGESCVSGLNRYTTGIHHIRFRIEEKNNKYWFFGIVTASETLSSNIFSLPSAYGWWEFDSSIKHGTIAEDGETKIIRKNDDITLILNCETRQIHLHHDRTPKIVEMTVDLQFCPFPWKIVVTLCSKNDSIRILH